MRLLTRAWLDFGARLLNSPPATATFFCLLGRIRSGAKGRITLIEDCMGRDPRR
jgi:hypothetical protein